jgi:tetrahydromethanopterin S-methyltransferase subunit H
MGKVASPETKQKMSAAKLGKTKSKETIENMSKAKLGLYAGEESHNSKTTWEIVRKIREEYSDGNITHKELGIKYNMSKNNVQSIITYKTWKS